MPYSSIQRFCFSNQYHYTKSDIRHVQNDITETQTQTFTLGFTERHNIRRIRSAGMEFFAWKPPVVDQDKEKGQVMTGVLEIDCWCTIGPTLSVYPICIYWMTDKCNCNIYCRILACHAP